MVQCGSGLAARDLSGQCRAILPTMGALEAIEGTSPVGATVLSVTTAQPSTRLLALSWTPFGANTAGYMVYYGTTASAVNIMASDLATNSGLTDPSAPSVTYNSVSNFGLYAGDTVCFNILAYNSARTVVGQIALSCRVI